MFVVCKRCGNVGCFEIVEACYRETAYELLECCVCGTLQKVVLV